MPGKSVNKTELAAIFGRPLKVLTEWQIQGMPHIAAEKKGIENTYDTAECFDWYLQRELRKAGKLNSDHEKAALYREQTEIAKRKNALAKGGVILLKDAKMVVERAAYSLRQFIVTCGMSHADKQRALLHIQSLKEADFEKIEEIESEDEETPPGATD